MSEVDEIREKALASIEHQKKAPGIFGWPLDGCAPEPWGYDLHVMWVCSWNATGRALPAEEHLRAWLAVDANIERALASSRARGRATPLRDFLSNPNL